MPVNKREGSFWPLPGIPCVGSGSPSNAVAAGRIRSSRAAPKPSGLEDGPAGDGVGARDLQEGRVQSGMFARSHATAIHAGRPPNPIPLTTSAAGRVDAATSGSLVAAKYLKSTTSSTFLVIVTR